MAYCRFGEDSDVYIYEHVDGNFECCACSLAKLEKSIFTTGLSEDDPRRKLFGDISVCEICGGEGCVECMIPGNNTFSTRTELIAHIKEHIKAGHKVPEDVIPILEQQLIEIGETNDPLFEDGYSGPVVFDSDTGEMKRACDFFEEFETEDEH